MVVLTGAFGKSYRSFACRTRGGYIVLSKLLIKAGIVRIINETQIIMHAAEEGRADVITRSLGRIQTIMGEIKEEVNHGIQ